MENDKVVSVSDAAKILGITRSAVDIKGNKLGVIHWDERFKKYYLYEKDLAKFKIDFRTKGNRKPRRNERKDDEAN